ncbi:uncharacterized protein BDZ99DRAFT_176025 [Mytilinidion resinicola]|uniref:Aldehyde dehydrogenase domain-containing protein n=1 Tax=Mytilinidion resinicola TaxID=574789 RepID=A0A6A6Y3T6_9PEZI|nr:uncharacterized protein BDZ99DRAFT_176025 [Mytilinidion resinicola]KAF2803183.1 hypothetical protein BDZ99DRAFT_176025 [Mytilinidion resinicola]
MFPDAELDHAAQSGASFIALSGQGCVLGTRIYVHEDIAEAYLGRTQNGALILFPSSLAL